MLFSGRSIIIIIAKEGGAFAPPLICFGGMSMRPLIAVTPLVDIQRDSYWMLPGYLKGLEAAGGAPLVLPLTQDTAVLEPILAHCSGLLLTGGQDVAPAVYGQEALPVCGQVCPERDSLEGWLLDWALERDIPVLGICRGLQFLNAHLGGTLYQDLPSQHPSQVVHCQRPPYDQPVHQVEVRPDTLLAHLVGAGALRVNSYHHQAVAAVAPGLVVDAVSEDGLVESLHLPGKHFVLGVQWHPEFCYQTSPEATAVFQGFVQACGEVRSA